jgi:uncharacterized protein YyaL (SSP411 family)
MKEDNEAAEPAASSVSVRNLARLAAMLHRDDWRTLASNTVRSFAPQLQRDPLSMPQMLASMGWLEGSSSLVLIHGEGDPASALVKEVWRQFLPRRALVRVDAGSRSFFEQKMDIVRELPADAQGIATGYVCENFVCQLPTRDPHEFARQLMKTKDTSFTRSASPLKSRSR